MNLGCRVNQNAGTKKSIGSGLQNVWTLLCDIKILNKIFCSNKAGNSATVLTPLGLATGVADTSTVARFVVKYANAGRWQQSTMVTTWQLP